MTRIGVKKMEFKSEFFEKEIRCGFEVSSLMKHAWAAQMEVLSELIRIFRENHIQYYAVGGTLLGAVRHGGYIPWDDDIDLMVKREDYNKLIQILPNSLPRGFVLSGIHSNIISEREKTSAFHLIVGADRELWEMGEFMKKFHGYPFPIVALDIFPLDYVPFDEEEFEAQKQLYQLALAIKDNWKELEEEKCLEQKLNAFQELSGVTICNSNPKLHLMQIMDKISSLYSKDEGDKLYCHMWPHEKAYEQSWYATTIQRPFENMLIDIPIGYDAVLKVQYGDYKIFRKFEASHNYPFYKKMLEEMEDLFKRKGYPFSVEEFSNGVNDGTIKLT